MTDERFPFPNKSSSMELFQRDPCYKKIAYHDVDSVFERAWNTGVNEAQRFIADHCVKKSRVMVDILKDLGFILDFKQKDCVVGDIRYFGEYQSAQNAICIYKDAVQLWADAQELPYDIAQDIILAHEYFHYLESHKIGWVSKQYQVPMIVFGRIKLGKVGIPALSEIAANAFANEYYKVIVLDRMFE